MRTMRWTALLVLVPFTTASFAQGSDFARRTRSESGRAGTFEMGIGVADSGSLGMLGLGGARLDVESDTGFSMWGGYNFGEHWQLAGEVTTTNPDYVATRVADDGTGAIDTIDAKLDMSTLQIKGVYNILAGKVTPYLELAAGWTQLDSNIIEGPVAFNCFFDPFFGYLCNRYFDTYTDTRPSYSGAVGVRWDINGTMALRASAGKMQIETASEDENLDFNTARVAFGWKF